MRFMFVLNGSREVTLNGFGSDTGRAYYHSQVFLIVHIKVVWLVTQW